MSNNQHDQTNANSPLNAIEDEIRRGHAADTINRLLEIPTLVRALFSDLSKRLEEVECAVSRLALIEERGVLARDKLENLQGEYKHAIDIIAERVRLSELYVERIRSMTWAVLVGGGAVWAVVTFFATMWVQLHK